MGPCRSVSFRELFNRETLIGHAYGAAGDTELSGQILPGGQSRARSKPSMLDAFSDRRINLRSERRLPGTIELYGEGSHCGKIQPKTAILVLYNDQVETHLVANSSLRK